MRAWVVAAAIIALTPLARAQSGSVLLESKGCLGCHGLNEKKMGPALREAAAKYKGSEGKLIEALRAGKGHPMPVDASPAELQVMLAYLQQKPAAKPAPAAEKPAAAATPLDNGTCLGCHGQQGFAASGRALHVPPEGYEKSVHGRNPCVTCHTDITEIPHKPRPDGANWRLTIPNVCGTCHAKQREDYGTSVHGTEVLKNKNPAAAVCSDCHTPHAIARPAADNVRTAITSNCGNCHVQSYRTYMRTYHGQVHLLGYAHTAKCFDCHDNHAIKRVSDPASTVHPNNRLATCGKCHERVTAGFGTFAPHATTDDFQRYPQMWISAKFMVALLVGVFFFFWTHTALWFYREWRDRKEGKTRPHVAADPSLGRQGKQYQRFAPMWRLAHLLFALSVMTLVLTGMAVLFADTAWAKAVVRALGGPQTSAIIHRTAATIMLGIFFIHLVYLAIRIGGNLRSFRWFGPTSLVPNWQDLKDIGAMFQWFFGRRPRPQFERWTYWEKFDYWAVFWGMAIIGGSGFMLAFPGLTAYFLPGWVLNVAALVHGEEAILAAVFLFTVHFFNNHFRPDKFPLDTVMFTGAVPLEEFRREHSLEYRRLVESGELSKYLVDAPSRPFTLGSKVLGFTLLAIGLVLLVLVLHGLLS
jgi:cytochrome b subunit of formate dehydrogenase/nitrate/TMAO reductase-like tetraheme cytochrome c subunit